MNEVMAVVMDEQETETKRTVKGSRKRKPLDLALSDNLDKIEKEFKIVVKSLTQLERYDLINEANTQIKAFIEYKNQLKNNLYNKVI